MGCCHPHCELDDDQLTALDFVRKKECGSRDDFRGLEAIVQYDVRRVLFVDGFATTIKGGAYRPMNGALRTGNQPELIDFLNDVKTLYYILESFRKQKIILKCIGFLR